MKKTTTKKSKRGPSQDSKRSAAGSHNGGSRSIKKRATIYDLARIAKVSPATVSRVLNNRERVKLETRERILKTAAELNLKPQATVREREVVLLSDPTFGDRVGGYAATLTAHLISALSQRNIGVMMPTDPFKVLSSNFFDGMVVLGCDKALLELIADIENRMPVVYIDKFPSDQNKYVVCSDHFSAGYQAAKHFLDRGRRRLAFIGPDLPATAQRYDGFKKALSEAEVPVDEKLVCLFAPDSIRASILRGLVQAKADALYAPGSSFESLEYMHYLVYVMGMKIPEDISLIGGENDKVSAMLCPPLTTIEEPLREMAEKAVEMIDHLTAGEEISEHDVKFPVRLIQRNSVL